MNNNLFRASAALNTTAAIIFAYDAIQTLSFINVLLMVANTMAVIYSVALLNFDKRMYKLKDGIEMPVQGPVNRELLRSMFK